ncbi:MAG: methyltransferase domain-containing protein [Tepidiphilus sp.]|nr:methyltransferase domain-containing protein [Tepidiphilus sp.]
MPEGWIIDAGCGIGRDLPLLAQRFGHERLLAVDFSPEALALMPASEVTRLSADLELLPLADAICAGYWSNCAWQWTRPQSVLAQAWRVLKARGWLWASIVLAGTFPELDRAVRTVGVTSALARLPAETEWEHALGTHSWYACRWEIRHFTFYYPDAETLLHAIRGVGANPTTHSGSPVWTPGRRRALLDALERERTEEGLGLSYRVGFLAACKKGG